MRGGRITSGYKGRTPLNLAVYYKDIPMIQLLLKYGADLNIPDEFGKTAISNIKRDVNRTKGAYRADNTIISLLEEHGAK